MDRYDVLCVCPAAACLHVSGCVAVSCCSACSLDLATASKVAGGWYGRLEELAWQNEVRGGGGNVRECEGGRE